MELIDACLVDQRQHKPFSDRHIENTVIFHGKFWHAISL